MLLKISWTVYFNKHFASFSSLYGHTTPLHSFNSIGSTCALSPKEQCKKWVEDIVKIVDDRITTEEERMPSYTALWRHWQRSCWIELLWYNSPLSDPYLNLPPPENSRWLLSTDGTYAIDWEDTNVASKIERCINSLTKGCKCKSGCTNNRCSCRKHSSHCGPGKFTS